MYLHNYILETFAILAAFVFPFYFIILFFQFKRANRHLAILLK